MEGVLFIIPCFHMLIAFVLFTVGSKKAPNESVGNLKQRGCVCILMLVKWCREEGVALNDAFIRYTLGTVSCQHPNMTKCIIGRIIAKFYIVRAHYC